MQKKARIPRDSGCGGPSFGLSSGVGAAGASRFSGGLKQAASCFGANSFFRGAMTAGRAAAAGRTASLPGERSAGSGAAALAPQGFPSRAWTPGRPLAASVAASSTIVAAGLFPGTRRCPAATRWL